MLVEKKRSADTMLFIMQADARMPLINPSR